MSLVRLEITYESINKKEIMQNVVQKSKKRKRHEEEREKGLH